MPLAFYYASGSPYSWRVWLALEHKGVPYELKLMSFDAGDLLRPEFLALNPRHQVPVVVDGGFVLYESAAIVEYLDEAFPREPALFPGNVHQRALARRLVREADQYVCTPMEALVAQILYTPREQWSEAAIGRAREALGKELALWEKLVAGDYLAGALSAADYSLYPALALCLRLDARKHDLGIQGLVGPVLAAWLRRMEALPQTVRTWPPHWK